MSFTDVPSCGTFTFLDFVAKVLTDKKFCDLINDIINATNDADKNTAVDQLFVYWGGPTNSIQKDKLRIALKDLNSEDPVLTKLVASGSVVKETALLSAFSDDSRPGTCG